MRRGWSRSPDASPDACRGRSPRSGRRTRATTSTGSSRSSGATRPTSSSRTPASRSSSAINPKLVALADETGLPLVATGDVHYLDADDAYAHEALLCIQSGDTLKNPDHWRFDTNEFFFKTPEEMAGDFLGLEHALARTLEVAERCSVELELGQILLPRYPVPEGRDAFDYLVELCEKGLLKRYGKATPELHERLRFELKTIREMGFADYFLIVWDFIHFAKQNGVSVGPGRGSSAGLARRLLPGDHRRRPDALRAALRALPQPGAQGPAGHGHRLLGRRPRSASSTTSPRSTDATGSRRSSPSRRWPRGRRSATRAGCSTSPTASSTGSRSSFPRAPARRSRTRSARAPSCGRRWTRIRSRRRSSTSRDRSRGSPAPTRSMRPASSSARSR